MNGVRRKGEAGRRIGMCLLLLGLLPAPVFAASIVGSRHNLSAGGPGTVKAGTETEICVFCHTPHNGTSEAPLWNRYSSGAVYIPYISTTVKSRPGQPTGASKLCLSCHDGTIALGAMRSRGTPIPMQGGVTVLPSGSTRLGTDLSDDHPVSFTFDAALASANGQLYDPSALTGPVRLDENRQLQCTACHDAHNNQYGKFLVKSNSASALCMTCHNKTWWSLSIHKTSGTNAWNGLSPDPWPHTEETTVAANGCENCHTPHNAGTKPRLLNFAGGRAELLPVPQRERRALQRPGGVQQDQRSSHRRHPRRARSHGRPREPAAPRRLRRLPQSARGQGAAPSRGNRSGDRRASRGSTPPAAPSPRSPTSTSSASAVTETASTAARRG